MTGGESTEEKLRPLSRDAEPGAFDKGNVSLINVLKGNDSRRAFFALVPTLTLGIIGGAVLPLAWAFSVTGIICGLVIMVVVAAANAYTCDLLLRQALVTGTYDYESLSFVIGGKWWKLTTEISIIILLVGSLVGALAQIGEVGSTGLLSFNSSLPNWLVGSDGRLIITFSLFFIVAPLCLVNRLRQLESAGIIGTGIVIWLMIVVIINCIAHGFPSIANKQFAVVGFSSIGDVTQAVSIFGFAFYIQPIMMPLLLEVPQGHIGMKIVSYSTRITVLVNAFFIYFFVGFFGAAYYGENTEEDILQNQWLGGGVAQGILNISMAVYLAIAQPVIEFPVRHTIDGWIPQRYLKGKFKRHVTITGAILIFSLAIALAFPSSSGNVLVVTGATGVCMVSYLIPVVNHLALHYNRTFIPPKVSSSHIGGEGVKDVEGNNKNAPTVASFNYRHQRTHALSILVEYSRDLALPIVVLVVGVFCSVASISTLGQS